MNQHSPRQDLPRAQRIAERILSSVSRFFHIEAVSGIVLLFAAAIALVWANSPAADTYHAVWHTPLTIGFGSFVLSQSLHFWINDALMTVFFLVVGMEIRREIHDGALASISLAALPLAAAIGGVVVPAFIYLGFNSTAISSQGWAVPTATDIAFAVGVLALLGRSIPGNVRVLLLALAIIDDIVAVLIIAVFYSGGLDYSGLLVAAIGIAMVVGLQKIGIGAAYAYIVPGGILWGGLLMTGAHPTLAGVVLGLMTPVFARKTTEPPLDVARRALQALSPSAEDGHHIAATLRTLDLARRELLAPVVRIPMVLHGWVAYGVMPLFALANAGVTLQGIDMGMSASHTVMFGVMCALVLGKPLGIIAASALVVRLGWCRLPPNVTWGGVCLIGLLAGIGFTMSIFIATLAFTDANLLGAAKLGVLLGSLVSGVAGLAWGVVYVRRRKQQGNNVIAAS